MTSFLPFFDSFLSPYGQDINPCTKVKRFHDN